MLYPNGNTLTSRARGRNDAALFADCVHIALLAVLSLALTIFSSTAVMAQEDPFSKPLKSLNKIDPVHVIQFRLVKLTTTGQQSTAELELDTRGGFKIYDHGLRFEYKSNATLNALIPLMSRAQPPAKTIQDPFYNEPRAVHERGAYFILTSDLPMDETGVVRVRFEACSVNTCLLPAYFLIQTRTGQTSRPEPKGESFAPPKGGGLAQPDLQPTQPVIPSPAATAIPATPKALKPAEPPAQPPPQPTTQPPASTPSLTDALTAEVQRSLLARSWILFPALFLAGLLMNLTPCVYPMIPITLNVLSRSQENGHQGDSKTSTRHTLPALMYAVGIILSYAAMGVVAGMTGSLFGGLLQSKIVNGVLAVLMFVLGLSMLDVFDLSRIQAAANRIPLSRKSPHLAVVTMGAVSGLVAAPCTGPVLSMLLLLVGQTKDPLYGFVLMSTFAAGFSAPYVFLGLLSQQIRRLPKAGLAMTIVKNVFAAMMFSLSLYYLKPILQSSGFLTLIYIEPSLIGVVTFIILTLLFLILNIRRVMTDISKIGLQIGLTVLMLWIALSAIKGFIPAENVDLPSWSRINDPVEIPNGSQSTSTKVVWYKNWKDAEQAAVTQGKGLIVDAWAQWCAACLKMDAEVWTEPGVEALINQHFIALKIDFTESNPESEELTKKWDLSGLPAVGIYPAKSDFSRPPTVLFREAVTVGTFHQAVQKIFNGEIRGQ
jgi:thiol:disulfide interchange protein DsbD